MKRRTLASRFFAFLTIATTTLVAFPLVGQEEMPVEQGASDVEVANQLKDQVGDIGETLNQSETVQDVSAGILQPIYQIAEYLSFPSFYWLAFALMTAGVVSFALQIVLAKFFLLFKGSLNLSEIISDLLCFVISLVGLVLTTQAATQNSDFTSSAVSVVSAAVVGAFIGFVLYWWAQKQEFRAVDGKRKAQMEG